MKFFTKERYEKGQVYGYLVYPENDEYYSIVKERYAEKESFYETAHRRDFSIRKSLMLKYLPESIKRGVYDESINPFLKLPPLDLLIEIKEWCKSVKNEYENTVLSISVFI
ncbi:conserved hypothetical protein [Candidatus Desulfosporosinus infrequens]|uniref:Uncharacterized protein n=1 Tax=Candidatus Desulfosporosinus infrequens TaxID=2043169 RepID=A0A2U3KA02_9FIRM|nr:conserved hypothetical protein [Candidatus Desulfosporosinus infrequens]